jgi:hypothetical protein
MNCTIEFNLASRKFSFLSLLIILVLLIACQNSHSSNSSQTQRTEQPANGQRTAPVSNQVTVNVPVNGKEGNTKPNIQITEIPPRGAGAERVETIAGTVSGVKINECKVVVFARTDTWYVQPYVASSDTFINEDNTWRTDTHLGSQYAALLVKNSYMPPSRTGRLPEVGGRVLAIAIASAKE